MFKRSTKLTALLVAAASVASTVPAMAATKLATKDGTIEAAVAYKDGKYLYQGHRTDDDDNGLYCPPLIEFERNEDDNGVVIKATNYDGTVSTSTIYDGKIASLYEVIEETLVIKDRSTATVENEVLML